MDPTTLKAKHLNAGAGRHVSRGSTYQTSKKAESPPLVSRRVSGERARGLYHEQGIVELPTVGSRSSRGQMPRAAMRARSEPISARASSSHVAGSRLGRSLTLAWDGTHSNHASSGYLDRARDLGTESCIAVHSKSLNSARRRTRRTRPRGGRRDPEERRSEVRGPVRKSAHASLGRRY